MQDNVSIINESQSTNNSFENDNDNSSEKADNSTDFNQNDAKISHVSPDSNKNAESSDNNDSNDDITVKLTDKNESLINEEIFAKENSSQNVIPLSVSELIERDFDKFKTIYPNISKSSLLSDGSFQLFAGRKPCSDLSELYSAFCQLTQAIEQGAIIKYLAAESSKRSSVGALSSSGASDGGFFTKEQVQRMSKEEISRNFKKIRESQQHW